MRPPGPPVVVRRLGRVRAVRPPAQGPSTGSPGRLGTGGLDEDVTQPHLINWPLVDSTKVSGESTPGHKMTISWPEKIPMSDEPDPLDAALKAFHKRKEGTERANAERERAARSRESSQRENLNQWSTSALQAVSLGVHGFNEDFARQQGSLFLFLRVPDASPNSVHFEVHRSGDLKTEGYLKFALREDGNVGVTASHATAKLPPAMAVDKVTQEWAKDAAKKMMVAFLDGQNR